MKTIAKFTRSAVLFGLASLGCAATACTNASPVSALPDYSSDSSLYTPAANAFPTSTTTTTTTTTTTPSTDGGLIGSTTATAPTTGVAPMSFQVGTVGYNSVTQTVSTRTILKVAFAAGQQDQAVAGTNYEPTYSHLGVYITVGSTTQATEMLSNGLLDGTPQTSRVIDFSSALPRTCTAGDMSCVQTVSIILSKPNNDYFCMNFYQYCPWAGVYSTHPWNGTLLVQTDDTDPITTASFQ